MKLSACRRKIARFQSTPCDSEPSRTLIISIDKAQHTFVDVFFFLSVYISRGRMDYLLYRRWKGLCLFGPHVSLNWLRAAMHQCAEETTKSTSSYDAVTFTGEAVVSRQRAHRGERVSMYPQRPICLHVATQWFLDVLGSVMIRVDDKRDYALYVRMRTGIFSIQWFARLPSF